MMTVSLTPGECEIIQHRLAVPDAIVEALHEMYHPDLLENAIEVLTGKLHGHIGITLTGIEVDVIRDCMDGSTFFANSEYWQPAKFATWSRVANSLESKFGGEIPRS